MVGAILVKGAKTIGRGWHQQAGRPHAEIEALLDARVRGLDAKGATLYVTLEPCCTHGRTPPCTQAILAAGVQRVVAATEDPNPAHSGRGFELLKRAGVKVTTGMLRAEAVRLNEAFNHWIVTRKPFVTVKAAMTLDGKIATGAGNSKWITGEEARAYGMHLRQGADAIVVGVNTIIKDDPRLTFRPNEVSARGSAIPKKLRRIILDGEARIPLKAKVANDEFRSETIIVVSKRAPQAKVRKLSKQVQVLVGKDYLSGKISLPWLLGKLGAQEITSLLVEGGGEVNGSFLNQGLANRVAFFYAPTVLGGRDSIRAVGGPGASDPKDVLQLRDVEYRQFGPDLFMTALLARNPQEELLIRANPSAGCS